MYSTGWSSKPRATTLFAITNQPRPKAVITVRLTVNCNFQNLLSRESDLFNTKDIFFFNNVQNTIVINLRQSHGLKINSLLEFALSNALLQIEECHPSVMQLLKGMWSIALRGASTVKYKGKILRYTKTIIFLVKCLKVIAMCCLNWFFFITPYIVVLSTQI